MKRNKDINKQTYDFILNVKCQIVEGDWPISNYTTVKTLPKQIIYILYINEIYYISLTKS